MKSIPVIEYAHFRLIEDDNFLTEGCGCAVNLMTMIFIYLFESSFYVFV